MKRGLVATCVALTCAVGLAAQTPPQAEGNKAQQTGKNVTLQGCLQAGEQPNTFVLNNVTKADPVMKGTATGTAGTMDPELTALKGSEVRLIGSPEGMELKAHVGHTVEITGALAPKDEKAKATPDRPAGTTGAADSRKLNVKSMKHVSATCTTGG